MLSEGDSRINALEGETIWGEVSLQENADADDEETGTEPISGKDGVNGSVRASSTSVTEVSEMKEMLLKDNVFIEVATSEHKAFLLKENRWELLGSNKQNCKGEAKSGTKCLACRGEGRLMCTDDIAAHYGVQRTDPLSLGRLNMGCATSKVETEDTVGRCSEQRCLMKQAAKSRHHFASAHADYLRHLRLTGSALSHFSAGGCLAVSDGTPPVFLSRSLSSSAAVPSPPAIP
ncbi:hypothetical protein EJ110_NYTH03810 [Nymphaea thermarum]|nr:hypothetical protein EJ110_NYTH03810 [Nymphaea thermarum]